MNLKSLNCSWHVCTCVPRYTSGQLTPGDSHTHMTKSAGDFQIGLTILIVFLGLGAMAINGMASEVFPYQAWAASPHARIPASSTYSSIHARRRPHNDTMGDTTRRRAQSLCASSSTDHNGSPCTTSQYLDLGGDYGNSRASYCSNDGCSGRDGNCDGYDGCGHRVCYCSVGIQCSAYCKHGCGRGSRCRRTDNFCGCLSSCGCKQCPSGKVAPRGATNQAQCKTITKHPSRHPTRHPTRYPTCTASCPANHYRTGKCGGTSNYACPACPSNTQSSAGANRCSPFAGYYGQPNQAAKRCTASCPANHYRTGSCGSTSNFACA